MPNKKKLQPSYHEERMTLGQLAAARKVGISERTAREWDRELKIGNHAPTPSAASPDAGLAPTVPRHAPPGVPPASRDITYAEEAEEPVILDDDEDELLDELLDVGGGGLPGGGSALDLPLAATTPPRPDLDPDLDPDRSIASSPDGRVGRPAFSDAGDQLVVRRINPHTGEEVPFGAQAPDPRYAKQSQVDQYRREHGPSRSAQRNREMMARVRAGRDQLPGYGDPRRGR